MGLGWIGSGFFALCALPQAYKACVEGHARGVSTVGLIFWTLGEIFTLAAVLQRGVIPFLIFNYVSNLLGLAVIWYYKYNPRDDWAFIDRFPPAD